MAAPTVIVRAGRSDDIDATFIAPTRVGHLGDQTITVDGGQTIRRSM